MRRLGTLRRGASRRWLRDRATAALAVALAAGSGWMEHLRQLGAEQERLGR